MKKIMFLSLAVLASISVASAQSLKAQANEMNAKVCKAFLKKDMDGFERLARAGVTSDFKYTDMGQTESFDKMLSQMKQSFAMLKKITSCQATSSHFAIHGDHATSETNHHMVGVMVGPDKKTHKMVMDGMSKDAYRKVGSKWKLSEMNWVNDKMTMDGKPFNPSQMDSGH